MMQQTKREVRPLFLILGALFLFNPNINLLDVLPDCLGYLFLLLGMGRAKSLLAHWDDAAVWFRRLALLTLSKIPVYFVMISLTGSNSSERVNVTLFTLVYTIAELILLFPAFSAFFAGIDYLAERYGIRALKDKTAENAKIMTFAALAGKLVLAFLPELTYLSDSDYAGYVTYARDIREFRYLFIGLAVFVGLILGILFLVYFIRMVRELGKCEELQTLLSSLHGEKSQTLEGHGRIRRIKIAFALLVAGSGCLINLYFDSVNYLPNGVALVLFACASLFLLPISKRAWWPFGFSLATLPFSLAAYGKRAQFFAEFSYAALGRREEADALYHEVELLSAAEGVLTVGLFLSLLFLLFSLLQSEVGYEAEWQDNRLSHLTLQRLFRRRAVIFTVIGSLTALTSAADIFLRRLTETVAQGTAGGTTATFTLPIVGWFWMVPFVFSSLLLLYAFYFFTDFGDEVESKYSLS